MEPLVPLRVAVLSRYELVRAGLTQLVHADPDRAVVVNSAAHDGHLQHVDVALCDLAGLGARHDVADAVAGDLRHLLSADVPVVGLGRDGRADLSDGARALGVRSIVPEDVTARHLLEVLEEAAGQAAPSRSSGRGPAVLTERERDVLRLIATGLSNQQIADELFVSINSVKTYVRAAYRKIGVTSRPDAVLWAIQYHLVPRPG